MSKKRLRFIIGGVVIVVAVVALVAFAMTKNSVFYYTVSELEAKGQSENVRVSGNLVRGTIQKGGVGEPITFKIQDKTAVDKVIAVTYTGNVPDTFREPRAEDPTPEVIVEGDYNAGTDQFSATFLMAKCPSKYEAQAKAEDATSTTAGGTTNTSNYRLGDVGSRLPGPSRQRPCGSGRHREELHDGGAFRMNQIGYTALLLALVLSAFAHGRACHRRASGPQGPDQERRTGRVCTGRRGGARLVGAGVGALDPRLLERLRVRSTRRANSPGPTRSRPSGPATRAPCCCGW